MGTNIERLKKLKELAMRGVGGEREQAIALLDKLTKKYGVSCDDLDETVKKNFVFEYHGKFERSLLLQIAYKVRNDRGEIYDRRYTESGRKCNIEVAITCTEAEKLEIEFLFEFYKRLWKSEVDFLLSAFIQKHRLFGELKEGEEGETLSDEDYAKLYAMMKGLDDEKPLAQITDGK